MGTLDIVAQYCGIVTTIAAAVALLVKPVREKLFGLTEIKEGQKCLLRAQMLSIYYNAKDNKNVIRQYELENFILMYAAYKAMKGNSFMGKVNKEILEMEVVS
jgi:hypothetical protein